MQNPKVSVLMPVHNGAAFLAEAMRSILSQTFTDFELIIINDGSTDRSLRIAEGFAARDPRVRIHSRPSTGIVGALNDGIHLATGCYAARMDADDIALPQRFDKQVALLEAHPEIVAVGAWTRIIDPSGVPLREVHLPVSHQEIDAQFLQGLGGAIAHPAAMIRLDALRSVGGYRRAFQLAEDLDLFLRLGEIGLLANVPEILLLYREHLASSSFTRQREQAELARLAAAAAKLRRGLCHQPDNGKEKEAPIPVSVADRRRSWTLRAIDAGQLRVARRHALAHLWQRPLQAEAWRLLRWSLTG